MVDGGAGAFWIEKAYARAPRQESSVRKRLELADKEKDGEKARCVGRHPVVQGLTKPRKTLGAFC